MTTGRVLGRIGRPPPDGMADSSGAQSFYSFALNTLADAHASVRIAPDIATVRSWGSTLATRLSAAGNDAVSLSGSRWAAVPAPQYAHVGLGHPIGRLLLLVRFLGRVARGSFFSFVWR